MSMVFSRDINVTSAPSTHVLVQQCKPSHVQQSCSHADLRVPCHAEWMDLERNLLHTGERGLGYK